MDQRSVQSRSSSSVNTDKFFDQFLVKPKHPNFCKFGNHEIELVKSSGYFPPNVVFRPFDSSLKSDHASSIWVCFTEYPFTLGLTYPFPPLITEFFAVTQLAFSQVMPVVWRVLFVLNKLNHDYDLALSTSEIARMYQLRTHGSSRFVLQRRSGAPFMVLKTTQNDIEWRNRFFFVRRDSIPDGDLLPLKWIPKAFKFESVSPPRPDTDDILRHFFEIEEKERTFTGGPILPEGSSNSQYYEETMSSDNLFQLADLETFLSVKKEKPSPSAIKTRSLPLRSSSKGKKRKTLETVDLEPSDDVSPLELLSSLRQSIEKLVADKDASDKNAEELEDQNKILEAKTKHLEKENTKLRKQVKDAEAVLKRRLKETVDGAMKSASTAILTAKIEMAKKAEAEGMTLWADDVKGWGEALAELAGVKAAEEAVNPKGKDAEEAEVGEMEDDAGGSKDGAEGGEIGR